MNTTKYLAVAVIAAALTITGCSSEEPSDPVTVTETSSTSDYEPGSWEPAESTTTGDDYSIDESDSDEAIADVAMEVAWTNMDTEAQTNICDGWALDKSAMTTVFIDGVDDLEVTRDQVVVFFDGKCGA